MMNQDNFTELTVGDIINIGGHVKITDMLKLFERVVKENIPTEKKYEDFTGGYIQQLSNSNQLVLYFGYKRKYDKEKGELVNTKNRESVKLNISSEELDIFYVGLKIMVANLRINKHSGKNKNVSMISYVEEDSKLELLPSKTEVTIISECPIDKYEDAEDE